MHVASAPSSPFDLLDGFLHFEMRLSRREHVLAEARRSVAQVKVGIAHGKTVLVHAQISWSTAFSALSPGKLSGTSRPTCPRCSVSPVTVMAVTFHLSFLLSFPQSPMSHMHFFFCILEHFADSCCLTVTLTMIFQFCFFFSRRFFNQVTVDRVAQNGPRASLVLI